MVDGDESLPRLLGGRYRLEATIGHGGMGVVYRATDMTMQRPVAVKLIRAEGSVELDEDVAGRFVREAKNTARIQHENIIEVFDLGRSDDGEMFFVMELLEGESLSTRLRREGPLSVETTLHIVRQICDALHVAHVAGIIHRDLKPANIMLLERAGVPDFVKVLDFGVAKSYSPDQQTQLTHTGMLVGTIEYMAPEQIMAKTVDGRTDVYSLGVLAYRMLAGKAPFRDGGVPALIHAHLNVAPTGLRELAPQVPVALELAIMKALSKSPADRHASMQDFARALKTSGARPPDVMGLVDLAYDEDPYEEGDQTEYVRPSSDPAPEFDDATVKMERRRPSSKERVSAGARAAPMNFSDQTFVMPRDESASKREGLGAPREREPRTCAICRAVNPPHAAACAACGVSLAPEQQGVARARVGAQPPVPAAPAPPLVPGAYPGGLAVQPPPPLAPQPPYTPSSGVQGVPWGAPPAPRAPSIWERLLSWTGIKSR